MRTLRTLLVALILLTVLAPVAVAATAPSHTLLQRTTGPTAAANRASFYMDADDNYVYLAIDAGSYYKVLTAGAPLFTTPTAVTTADDGAGTSPAQTLTPVQSTIHYTCSDTDGCTIVLSETGAISGQKLTVINIGSNTATFADSAGVSETAGSFAAGAYDNISYQYVVDRWVETARVNN